MIGSPRDSLQALRDRKTIAREVAEVLRWKIIRGELLAGARITESSIADELNVSRGPVREALREIEKDGLATTEAYKGAVVVEISPDDLRGILLPMRHVIEQHAITNALPVMDDRDFAFLEAVTADMEVAATANEPGLLETIVDLDVAFHSYIIESYGHFHARQLWETISPRVRAGFYRMGSLHSHPSAIAREHRDLLEALRTRDLGTVQAALDEHVLASPIRLLERGEDEPAVADA